MKCYKCSKDAQTMIEDSMNNLCIERECTEDSITNFIFLCKYCYDEEEINVEILDNKKEEISNEKPDIVLTMFRIGIVFIAFIIGLKIIGVI